MQKHWSAHASTDRRETEEHQGSYVSNILAKLHARDRTELVMRAREAGYPEA